MLFDSSLYIQLYTQKNKFYNSEEFTIWLLYYQISKKKKEDWSF